MSTINEDQIKEANYHVNKLRLESLQQKSKSSITAIFVWGVLFGLTALVSNVTSGVIMMIIYGILIIVSGIIALNARKLGLYIASFLFIVPPILMFHYSELPTWVGAAIAALPMIFVVRSFIIDKKLETEKVAFKEKYPDK